MPALALVLHLALAAPALPPSGLAPRLDPGPFGGGELLASSVGVLAGDAAVVGGAYLTLRMFANGTIDPSAENFRRTAYVLGAAALVVPPVTAALLARWARAEPASGSTWKAILLAMVGQTAALAAGYALAPHYWVVFPAQLVAIGAGSTLGLHWGPRRRAFDASPAGHRAEPADRPAPAPAAAAARAPLCPDPALGSTG